MKLNSLHADPNDKTILENYVRKLRHLFYSNNRMLTEGKRVIVTTEIIDDDEDGIKITKEAKNEFIEKAKEIGEFGNVEWVKQIVNGLKQVGVQGCQPIAEDDRPVSNKEIKQLIGLLINLVSNSK